MCFTGLFREWVLKPLERSAGWLRVRKAYLKKNPRCAACGRRATQVHHVQPVRSHPARELDPVNLLSFCGTCHWVFGHLMDWGAVNPHVEMDAERFWFRIGRCWYA